MTLGQMYMFKMTLSIRLYWTAFSLPQSQFLVLLFQYKLI